MRLLTPICGSRELTIARPSSKVSSGLGTELVAVSVSGRLRVAKSMVKSGGITSDVAPTGDVLSVSPRKYKTETGLGRGAWFVTVTTVAERIWNPVSDLMNVTR